MILSIAHRVLILLSISTLNTVLASQSSSYAVKERHHVPQQWAQVGPAPAWHLIELQVGLKQGGFDELETHLYEGMASDGQWTCPRQVTWDLHPSSHKYTHADFLPVSDPAHPRYGQHLTADDISELVKPTNETIAQVQSWLLENNIPEDRLEYSPAKDWIKVTLPVKSIELLLDTKYSVFKHEDGSHLVRTPQWSLPAHLHDHIETIQPTNSFFRPRSKRSTLKRVPLDSGADQLHMTLVDSPSEARVQQACNASAVTPLCLRTLYGKSHISRLSIPSIKN
jgi:tripeptidyl-peptidase-1